MKLIPYEVGPLNPRLEDVAAAVLTFAVVFLFGTRMTGRLNRVLEERHAATEGVRDQAEACNAESKAVHEAIERCLAEARHDAARIRQQAREEGVGLITAAREDGRRERDDLLARNDARLESDRAAAESELRTHVSELASELAARVLGEAVPSRAERGN